MRKHYRIEPKLNDISYFDTGANFVDDYPRYTGTRETFPIENEIERPFGVTLLAFMFLGLGVSVFGSYFFKPTSLYSILNIQESSAFYSIYINFFSVFYLLTAVLMVSGSRFGWILGVQCALNTLFLQVNSLSMPAQIIDQVKTGTFDITNYVIDYSLHLTLLVVFLVYFYKKSIRKFFKVEFVSAIMIFLMLVCIAVGIHVAVFSYDQFVVSKS